VIKVLSFRETTTYSGGTELNIPKDNPVLKEIERLTSVKLDIVDVSGDKGTVMWASGETLDINSAGQASVKQIIDNNLAYDLTDMLPTHGKNLLKYHSKALNFYSEFLTNGKDILTPVYAADPTQKRITTYQPSPTGFYLRWDYFKEIGVPELKTLDDLIEALAKMQKSHPKTTGGKNVYGVSGWTDWGLWNFSIQFGFPNGMVNLSTTRNMTADNKIVNGLLDTESVFWKAADFYFKANQKGILDPDFFINKYDDYVTKYKGGQLLTLAASWTVGDAKTAIVEESPLSTFVAIPITIDFPYNTAITNPSYTSSGSGAFFKFVGSKTKYPERALEFLDALCTPEAARLIYSGVQGTHWDYVDGEPSMLPEVLEKINSDPNYLNDNGLGLGYSQLSAFSELVILPDGKSSDLIDYDTKLFKLKNTKGDQDFCDYYSIEYPGQLFEKLVNDKVLKNPERIGEISALMPVAPDEIIQINGQCEAYVTKSIAELILSKNQQEYDAKKTSIINELKKLGQEKVDEWYTNAFNDVRDRVMKSLNR
jgi:ABC-type glycerol-3-phosphate transport system substrate-binding protein